MAKIRLINMAYHSGNLNVLQKIFELRKPSNSPANVLITQLSSAVAIVTENAAKNYTDDSVEDEQPYLRKCFAHTGSFLNSSTSSFTAVTASAPSSLSST